MTEKITLDMLTQDSVSVKTQKYAEQEGHQHPLGQPHRKAYVNSVTGRQEVQDELPQTQQNAITAVWGGAPTMPENQET